jgi:hypothetical protein
MACYKPHAMPAAAVMVEGLGYVQRRESGCTVPFQVCSLLTSAYQFTDGRVHHFHRVIVLQQGNMSDLLHALISGPGMLRTAPTV